MKIFHAGQIGASGFGWATCNNALAREFEKLGVLGGPESEVHWIPIADHNLTPSAPLNGKVNIGYCFFEYELGPDAKKNADRFDVVFAGSTWCLERLKERGVTNGAVLIQGVDTTIFRPGERKPDGQFRIFSGGKFEYRKGQDLVIAAFREFSKTHPDAHLVCSWFNPWQQLIGSMCQSPHIDMGGIMHTNNLPSRLQFEFYRFLFTINGIDSDRVTILPQLSQPDLAREMQNTDCALFPNRCEGGTNLVLMEYAACGRPVVANALTGHRDVILAIDAIIPAVPDRALWAAQYTEDILDALEYAYAFDWEYPPNGVTPGAKQWTWEAAARKVIEAAERIDVRVT